MLSLSSKWLSTNGNTHMWGVSDGPLALSVQGSQLRHELSMKDELLQFYTSAAEESEPESLCSTP